MRNTCKAYGRGTSTYWARLWALRNGTDCVENVGVVEETAGAKAAAIGSDTLAILDLLLIGVLLLLGFHLVRIFPNHIRVICHMPEQALGHSTTGNKYMALPIIDSSTG